MVHISEAIKSDHHKMQSYYNTLVCSEDADEKTRIQKEFIWELTRHAVSEELVVYPAMEEFLPDGMTIADKDRQEHCTVSAPNCDAWSIF
jgi:hemerythrin superfamily protein